MKWFNLSEHSTKEIIKFIEKCGTRTFIGKFKSAFISEGWYSQEIWVEISPEGSLIFYLNREVSDGLPEKISVIQATPCSPIAIFPFPTMRNKVLED